MTPVGDPHVTFRVDCHSLRFSELSGFRSLRAHRFQIFATFVEYFKLSPVGFGHPHVAVASDRYAFCSPDPPRPHSFEEFASLAELLDARVALVQDPDVSSRV